MALPPVIRIAPSEVDDVVDILVATFDGYPAMTYMLGPDATPEDLDALVSYFVRSRAAVDSPIFGMRDNTSQALIAAALVDPPDPPQRSGFEELRAAVGEAVVARMDLFEDAIVPLEPTEPFYYVGMIGVAAEHRGHGLARVLLDHVHAMSVADPSSIGVVLTTENRDNLAIYENVGFEVIGEAETTDGRLQSWTLIRPN